MKETIKALLIIAVFIGGGFLLSFFITYLFALGITWVLNGLNLIDWTGKEIFVAAALWLISLILKVLK